MARLSDYDYELPEQAIAQRPLEDRANSRLLHLRLDNGQIEHRIFRDVVDILQPDDLLVLNDTRVTAVRLRGHKPSGGAVEALLVRAVSPARFQALVKPGRRLQSGAEINFGPGLDAKVEDVLENGMRVLRFEPVDDLPERLREFGTVPLPPYICERLEDAERYQTVYARHGGSSAAPTAGLHFTPELLSELKTKGVKTTTVTLDVGIDTFRPIESEDPTKHAIHGERCRLTEETARAVRECRGRIIAVGTTSVRTLETFASGRRQLTPGEVESRLFIYPGYEFKVVDGMFTNFHMPRTTMLLLISALAGRDRIMDAYGQALARGYRFLSFGDSMLIL